MVKVNATIGEIERFMESALYKDIRRELITWMRMAKEETVPLMMSCASDNPPVNAAAKLAYLAGRIETLEYVLQLPSNFIATLKETSNAGRNKAD